MWLPAAPLVGALLVSDLLVGTLLVGTPLVGAPLVGALLLASVASAAAADSARGSSVSETQLVKNLRKQLMRDNSDYSHEIPKNTEIHRRADSELDKTIENITSNHYVTKQLYRPVTEHRDDDDSKTEDIVGGSEYKVKSEVPVSEKDLLYYVDEAKLVGHEPEDRKYKTLKVRHQFRRSGQRKYIQEEGTEGVAILSLSRAPFPELRLPRSRRQYRHEHGDAATDDEGVPPPPPDDEGIPPPLPDDKGIPPPPPEGDRPAAADDVTATAAL